MQNKIFHTLLLFMALAFLLKPINIKAALVAELSSDKIDIDSDFDGMDLLIFGSKKKEDEIIILVKGGKKNFNIFKKTKLLGVWVNTEKNLIKDAYSFYYIASTKNINEFDKLTLKKLGIGIENIPLKINKKNKAIIDYAKSKLYNSEISSIQTIEGVLFKESISFPHNTTTGRYTAQVFLFRENKLISSKILPITVEDRGIDAIIYKLSRTHKILYGLISVLAGVLIGVFSDIILRKLY